MAGRLLLIVALCSFNVVKIGALLPPKLTVNPLVITETDPVMLDCQIPATVSVSQCYFNIAKRKPARTFSCLKTLTGTELLLLAQQSSPATVEVTCFYLKTHQSPHSNMISVSIEIPRPELRVNPASVTETDSVTVNCVTPPSVSVTECYLYSLRTNAAKVISCLQTVTGTELLSMANQRLSAGVQLKCFYTTGQYQSPHSFMSSIRIDVKSTTTQMTTFSTTTDFIASTPTDPVTSLSTSVTSVKAASETVSEEIDEATTYTLTTARLPVTLTDRSPETVSEGIDEATTETLTSALLLVTPTNSSPGGLAFADTTLINPASDDKVTERILWGTGAAVAVGVILFGIALLFNKDDMIYVVGVTNRAVVDETYSVVTYKYKTE